MLSRVAPIILFCLFVTACQKKIATNNSILLQQTIPGLLNRANDSKMGLKNRLQLALQADSIAMAIGAETSRLATEMAVASLYLKSGSTDSAMAYFQKNVALARRLQGYEAEGIALNNIGIIYNGRSGYDSALRYYTEAKLAFARNNDSLHLGQALTNIGIVYKNQGVYEDAFKITLEAVRVLEPLKDNKDLGSAYVNIGNVMGELGRWDEALHYHEMALQIHSGINDSTGMAASRNNIGTAYRNKKMYTQALASYAQALGLKMKLGNKKSIAATIDNIGQAYLELGNTDTAEAYFKHALTIRETAGDHEGFLTTSNKLAKLYLATNNLKNAEAIALKAYAVSLQKGWLKPRLDNNMALLEVYRRTGRDKLAAGLITKVMGLKDSLFNNDMAVSVAQMQARYKTEQKEKELAAAKQLQAVQRYQIKAQRLFIIFLVVFLLSLAVLALLLYRSNKAIKLANQRIETLMKELNHRVKNNLQLVSGMLSLQVNMARDEAQVASLQACINRVGSMNIIHTLLYKSGFDGTINMKVFLDELISNLSFTYQEKSAKFRVSVLVPDLMLEVNKAIPVGLVINEIITNIFKYAKAGAGSPTLEVALNKADTKYNLLVTDNCEIWDTNSARAKKSGLGLFLVETLVKQLKGEWKLESKENGTVHLILF